MSKIIIRELEGKDTEKFVEYTKLIGSQTQNLSYGAEGINKSQSEIETFIKTTRSSINSVLLGAWEKDNLIGVANLNNRHGRMSHRADLGLSVIKSRWNLGFGSMLMSSLKSFAKTKNIEIINLEVRADNKPAIHLYEKFGFVKKGDFPAYFKIGSNYIDFILMCLDLR